MDDINSIGVYCASSNGKNEIYKTTASRLGHLIALNKKRLIYGGGNIGTMKALADSSYANGGEVIGIITKHLLKREKNEFLGELFGVRVHIVFSKGVLINFGILDHKSAISPPK